MIVQFEGAKRTLTFIFGKHVGDPDDEVFVSNTSGDFDPAPSDDDDLDDDGESDGFGFRPQRTAGNDTGPSTSVNRCRRSGGAKTGPR